MENNNIIDVTMIDKTSPNLVGNLYMGRVEKIVNKQFCFVKIDENTNCFIDMKDSKEEIFTTSKIHQGSKLLVEVTKNKTHDKVAKATTEFTIYNKGFLHIFLKDRKEIRISKSISDKNERNRLKALGEKLEGKFSILFRTASANLSYEEIEEEYKILAQKMEKLIKESEYISPPSLLINNAYMKEIYNKSTDVEEVITNNSEVYDTLCGTLSNTKVTYSDSIVINSTVQNKIEKLFSKKVWLKSGGYIYIEETESAVLVDVNSGKFTGEKNQEKASLKTNMEALEATFSEIRLRNLSGIILIDLINLRDKEALPIIESKVRELLKNDSKKMSFDTITSLFLVQLTRKKELGSLKEMNTSICHECHGHGFVLDLNYLCDKIFREIFWFGENTSNKKYEICASSKVIKSFKDENLFLINILKDKFQMEIAFSECHGRSLDFYEVKHLT